MFRTGVRACATLRVKKKDKLRFVGVNGIGAKPPGTVVGVTAGKPIAAAARCCVVWCCRYAVATPRIVDDACTVFLYTRARRRLFSLARRPLAVDGCHSSPNASWISVVVPRDGRTKRAKQRGIPAAPGKNAHRRKRKEKRSWW